MKLTQNITYPLYISEISLENSNIITLDPTLNKIIWLIFFQILLLKLKTQKKVIFPTIPGISAEFRTIPIQLNLSNLIDS